MSKQRLVIDRTTGTVLDLAGCYVIDADQLDDTFTDSEVSDLAERVGLKIETPCWCAGHVGESVALEQMSRWGRMYGWKYAVFTRDDVRQTVVDMYGETETLDLHVAKAMQTRMWVKTLEDSVIREGMECVYDAVEMVKQGV